MAKNSNSTTTIDGNLTTEQEFNAKARQWAQMVRNLAKANTVSFTKGKTASTHTYEKGIHKGKTEGKLSKKLSFVIKEKDGVIDNIGYRFPLHGVFREWGVGNGQPRSADKKQAKQVSIRRSMSDWLDNPIDKSTEKLADIAADFYGDQASVNTWGAKIKK